MKKLLHFAILAILFMPSLSFASFDVNLKYGSKGQSVLSLQDFLQDQGFLTAKPNSYFGLSTLKALKAFQLAQGITPASGYFGPLTRSKANILLTTSLSDSNNAEKTETGTITPPVVEAKPVNDTVTQNKLDALTNQVNTLSQQLQTQTQQLQTQTKVQQQIAQNTTPITPPVIPPVAITTPVIVPPPVVTPPVATTPTPEVIPTITASIRLPLSTPSKNITPTDGFDTVIGFRFLASGGDTGVSDLKFSVTNNTVSRIKVGDVSVAPVNGIVDITVSIPLHSGAGQDVYVYVSYNPVGQSGVASGTQSTVTLIYFGRRLDGTTTSISAPTMTLVSAQ